MFIQQFNFHWRKGLAVSLVGLSLILFIAACSSGKEDDSAKEKFSVTNPIVTDTIYTSEYVADIHSLQNVELRARVKGYIEKIHVDEGQTVKAGQLLFSISSQEYKQEVMKAKAMLTSAVADAKVAEVDLSNVKILVNKNVVSKSELEMAQAKLDAFQAKIEEAKAHEANAILQLSFTEVRAPFSGVINRIINKAGSLIDEGTLLTTLSDNHEVFAYFNVSETDYLDIVEQGNEDKKYGVELIMANHQPHPYKGVIETVEGEVDKSTGNIAFRARFKNPELVLKNGSTGKIKLNHEIENAMLIPQKSTFEIQDNLYVYVIDDKNVVQLRSIKSTLRIPHLYVIETGLTTKDRILYEGIQRVKEGDLIEPEVLTMKSIIAQLAKL
ncbi:MAG: efflux RND transporter periplasmic adaptor subunit [Bacteroidetes bacterium]|nr:efflux RND transporter periplasmic adaptor subunit [Bacteroidota bacterium]